jgi:SanA protein
VIFAIFILIILVLIIPRIYTAIITSTNIYQVQNAPNAQVAIIFGAGLRRDGEPTTVLRDRVQTAAELYFSGKVLKLLMSGDNSYDYYNEPGAMKSYALELGIPEKDIVLDFAGRRTYDTCYRAKNIFGVDKALIVTQSFHLPRALFLCNHLGIEGSGVTADRRRYSLRAQLFWNVREIPATLSALWDVWVIRPVPTLGDPEPIFPLSSNTNSNK